MSGVLAGTLLVMIARMLAEIFRQPDVHIGFLALGGTKGLYVIAHVTGCLGLIIQGIRRL